MTAWLQITPEQRSATLNNAAYTSGIPANVIEKDWWVTLTLKALFQTQYAQQMIFKGGTSLSKCWKLIERFSEDIDIGLAPEAFGMEYKIDPSRTYVDNLKKQGCSFTSTELLTALQTQLTALEVPDGMITLEAKVVPADHPDTDPQTLLLHFHSLFPTSDYVASTVKIEVAVRSRAMPNSRVAAISLLSEISPSDIYPETPTVVTAVAPRKTFLEKAFLLHEEFSKPDRARIRSHRMSRHLYDIGSIVGTDVETEALTDHELYDHLITHRENYQRFKWFDYKTLGHKTINFIPGDDIIESYRADYRTMQEQMIWGDSLEFDALIDRLTALQDRFREKMNKQ